MPNLILLSLLAAFPPLSTDMYLPAIPRIVEAWGISLALGNLSLVVYFVTFSLFLLIHGPLSDRFGRKPILVVGILVFIAGSWLCAMSSGIVFLVAARAVQGAGAAAASALALALSKDLYEGVERQKILALIGVIMAFCPMLAPSVGGLMLKIGSWRWIFISQGIAALAALYGVMLLKEPLTEFTSGGVLAVVGRYGAVFKNGRFSLMAIAFAMMVLPHFAFIGGSPAIYITGFGMSDQVFGLFFGANALGFMLGSLACSRMSGVMSPMRILYVALCAIFAAGVALLLLGGTNPYTVAVPMFCITFFMGFSRPVSNSLILDQVNTDVGAASGIMAFEMFLVGAIAMEIIALDWQSKTGVLGVLALIGTVIPLIVLLAMRAASRKADR